MCTLQCGGRSVACVLIIGALCLLISADAWAIKDEDNQGRWEKPCSNGPDAVVPGFLVNMGPTGARGILKSNSLLVKYIFASSPADGVLKLDDEVYGANGKKFATHTFGGRAHGLEGPIMDMGLAIEDSEGGDGVLHLMVRRDGVEQIVDVQLEKLGRFADTFPVNCKKTEILKSRAYKYLMDHPGGLNSQGRCVATLALLSSDDAKVFDAGKRMALSWNRPYDEQTWSWHLGFQGITLAEYHLLTGDKSVLPTLQSALDLLCKAQWVPPIHHWKRDDPKEQEAWDRHQALYEGGFSHAPYPVIVKRGGGGYGPMQRPTYLAIIAWQLGRQCGLDVSDKALDRSFQFVEYGTNRAGLTAYGGEFTLNNGPVDPTKWKSSTNNGCSHKSGMAYLLYRLSPERTDAAAKMKLHLSNIDAAYKDMPDGHACPMLGLVWGWAGVYASDDAALKKKITDYYKAWLNMARCHGSDSYVILPGRNYADESYYRDNIRNHTTASVAFLYSYATPKCQVQGVSVAIPGVNHLQLQGTEAAAYRSVMARAFGEGAKTLGALPEVTDPESAAGKIMAYIGQRTDAALQTLAELERTGQWSTLADRLKAAQQSYAGVPAFDRQAAIWTDMLTGETGRLIVKAHDLILRGSYGPAIVALGQIDAQGAAASAHKALLATADTATRQQVERYQSMFEQGQWDSLKTALMRERIKLKGAAVFDEACAEWDAAMKGTAGLMIASAQNSLARGRLNDAAKALATATAGDAPQAVRAVAATVQQAIDEQVRQRLAPMATDEEQGDWYALSRSLPAAEKDMKGIASFDEAADAWLKQMQSEDVRHIIEAGRKYASIETVWAKSQGAAVRREVEAFIARYPDTIYAQRAKALLAQATE